MLFGFLPLIKEINSGKFNFSLFETKIPENAKAEDYFWTYDVVWNPYKPANTSNNYSNSYDYAEPAGYTQGPNGNIPVYTEDDVDLYR